MTFSMTAFAREEARQDQISLSWELRSVNQRYLDSSFRLPEEFRDMEQQLQQLLKTKVTRGKVECTLKMTGQAKESYEISVNQAVLNALMTKINELKQTLPLADYLNPMEVLKWPGVIEDKSVRSDDLTSLVISTFTLALGSLISMRQREGETLKGFLLTNLDDLESIVLQLRKDAPTIALQLKEKVTSKLEDLNFELDKGRLEQEIIFLAQKADVREELDRLISHIEEVKSTLDLNKPVGRKLDFLMQELNREANTLGSKSTLAETSLHAVEIKVLIEQMREQIQNIE